VLVLWFKQMNPAFTCGPLLGHGPTYERRNPPSLTGIIRFDLNTSVGTSHYLP